ncbi:DUF2029 domain-containing protein [bacterium]|nr:DUF2029 domain-containing protein [bacterium]
MSSLGIRKIIYYFFLLCLAVAGFFIFSCYLNYIFHPYCLKLGYTLCAAVGEDFYSLYQSTFNFFHNYFIYGKSASLHLVTPYFMPFKYLPATPLLVGWPFALSSDPDSAYQLFLWISVILHLFSLYILYLIGKKLKAKPMIIAVALFIWLCYFSIISNWRMGQFNHLSAVFFLFTIAAVLYKKKILAAFSWIISLAWKPVAILSFPYFWKRKNKLALILFFLFFVLFTAVYLGYWQLFFPSAIKTFLQTVLLLEDRLPCQVHYIDNFGVYAFGGEIFFDHARRIWNIFSLIYPYLVLLFYGFITLRVKLEKQPERIYYLLFTFATILIWHKEFWESWLVSWLPIVTILLLMSHKKRDIVFILINMFFLATPTLYYFQQQHPASSLWRFALIAEKAIPQLLVYLYLSSKLLCQNRKQSSIKQAAT